VERRVHVGARVVPLSRKRLIDLYEVREALEGAAVRLAAERMSDDAIQDLKDLMDRHRRDLARELRQAVVQQEGAFDLHDRIVGGSDNQRMVRILCGELYCPVRMYHCRFGMKRDRAQAALKEHGLIVDAIAERDGELAEWLTRRHVRASGRAVEMRLAAGQA
jgi:DNA-binding GntR family transcriptional regulator